MPTNNIIKALITVFALHIYVDLTFAAPHRSSPKKRAISVYDTVPCFVNIRLSGQRMPPCISIPEDYMVDDSIGFVKENNRQRMGKKNVIFYIGRLYRVFTLTRQFQTLQSSIPFCWKPLQGNMARFSLNYLK